MLDVGQGDAFLIQSNSQTILVDTGQSEQKLFAALSRQGCTHLDAVIITHADNDHAGCLSALKGVVDCERVILLREQTTFKWKERNLWLMMQNRL